MNTLPAFVMGCTHWFVSLQREGFRLDAETDISLASVRQTSDVHWMKTLNTHWSDFDPLLIRLPSCDVSVQQKHIYSVDLFVIDENLLSFGFRFSIFVRCSDFVTTNSLKRIKRKIVLFRNYSTNSFDSSPCCFTRSHESRRHGRGCTRYIIMKHKLFVK